MIKLINEKEGYSHLRYYGYNVDSTSISLRELCKFINDFELNLRNQSIIKEFGFLYDITITCIDTVSDHLCNIDFICRVSK